MTSGRRRSVLIAILAFAPPLAVMAAVALFYGEPVGTLTNDPVEIADFPTRYGLLANASLALWGAAVGVTLLGAAAAFRVGRRSDARWLATGAFLSIVLLADDMLMLHDHVLEDVGIPERATLLVLAGAVVALTWWNRRAFTRTNLVLFVMTCCWFGVWAVSGGALFDGGEYLQDIGKLCGICGWLAYFSLAAWDSTAPIAEVAETTGPAGLAAHTAPAGTGAPAGRS